MVRQRHINCKLHGCEICLDDCKDLASHLETLTGISSEFVDHLQKYREYLDEQNIKAESDFGWPTAEVFDSDNISRYVNDSKENIMNAYIYEVKIGLHKFFVYPEEDVYSKQTLQSLIAEREYMGYLKGHSDGPVRIIKIENGEGYVWEGIWEKAETDVVRLEKVNEWKSGRKTDS